MCLSFTINQVIMGGGRRELTPRDFIDPEYPEKDGHREDGRNIIRTYSSNRHYYGPFRNHGFGFGFGSGKLCFDICACFAYALRASDERTEPEAKSKAEGVVSKRVYYKNRGSTKKNAQTYFSQGVGKSRDNVINVEIVQTKQLADC